MGVGGSVTNQNHPPGGSMPNYPESMCLDEYVKMKLGNAEPLRKDSSVSKTPPPINEGFCSDRIARQMDFGVFAGHDQSAIVNLILNNPEKILPDPEEVKKQQEDNKDWLPDSIACMSSVQSRRYMKPEQAARLQQHHEQNVPFAKAAQLNRVRDQQAEQLRQARRAQRR